MTFVALLPKKLGVEALKDFRPFSLVGSMYKIFAKVLANRLKSILGKLISPTQSVFAHGWQILDPILIANECLDSHIKAGLPGVLYKLDLEKAYDHVDCIFLPFGMLLMTASFDWLLFLNYNFISSHTSCV